MAYIYDPSQQISQSLGKAAAGAGNIFSQLIAQKQQDYALAQQLETNVESLKKGLNQFSQKSITDKSNALLNDVRSSIFKDGKLDYSKLRDVRNQISEISDLKQGYEVAANEFQRRLELGIQTKDDMVSFTNYWNDLTALLSNEDLIRNPKDLNTAFKNVYLDNIDFQKYVGRVLSSELNTQELTEDYVDKVSGDRKTFVAKAYGNQYFDKQTGKIVVDEKKTDLNATYANLKEKYPELLTLFERNYGSAAGYFNETNGGQLVKKLIDMTTVSPKFETKLTSDQILGQKLSNKKSSEQIKNLEFMNTPEMQNLTKEGMEAEVALTQARAGNIGAQNLVMYNPTSFYTPSKIDIPTNVSGKKETSETSVEQYALKVPKNKLPVIEGKYMYSDGKVEKQNFLVEILYKTKDGKFYAKGQQANSAGKGEGNPNKIYELDEASYTNLLGKYKEIATTKDAPMWEKDLSIFFGKERYVPQAMNFLGNPQVSGDQFFGTTQSK